MKRNPRCENVGIKLICECLENADIGLPDIVEHVHNKIRDNSELKKILDKQKEVVEGNLKVIERLEAD